MKKLLFFVVLLACISCSSVHKMPKAATAVLPGCEEMKGKKIPKQGIQATTSIYDKSGRIK